MFPLPAQLSLNCAWRTDSNRKQRESQKKPLIVERTPQTQIENTTRSTYPPSRTQCLTFPNLQILLRILCVLQRVPNPNYVMSFGSIVIKLHARKELFQSISSEGGFERNTVEFVQSIKR